MSTIISVALIIPVMNERSKLEVLLPRLDQLKINDLIIVDGKSEDGTIELLKSSGIQYTSAKRGRSSQMNVGSAKSKSKILLFFHADTVLNSSHIEDIKAAMRDPTVVGGRFDVRLSGAHPAFRIIEIMMNLRSRLTKISTGDQAMFVRREVFDNIGGFPDQPLMEDIAFSKLLKKQGKIACLRRKIITSSRRWEKHGIVRTVLLMWRLRLMYWLGVSPERLAAMYQEAR